MCRGKDQQNSPYIRKYGDCTPHAHLQAASFGGRSVTALSATADRAAVLEADAAKNVYGGLYHVREPESQALAMRFGDAAECIAAWQGRRMLVRVCAPSSNSVAIYCSLVLTGCDK